MSVRYALLDPTGNTTILVETPVSPADQPRIAAGLMEKEPSAEQVGFLTAAEDGVSLRMAGGEFCGNAAMSAAALLLLDRGIAAGVFTVAVSGTEEPVPVAVHQQADGSVRGTVTMPRPLSAGEERLPDGSLRPVVRFGGITHVILETAPDRAWAEAAARAWCADLQADALGLMFLDRDAGTLHPLVYVPAADTLFWENSCASGTAAVGAWLLAETGGRIDLRQPGGTLTVEAADGRLRLTGTVRLLHRSRA